MSFAFLLAYVWLFVGRVVVQGSTQFIDLPSDFATTLGATSGSSASNDEYGMRYT